MFTPLRMSGPPLDRRRRRPGALLALAILLVAFTAASLVRSSPAHALTSSGHGVGYLSAADGTSWLGSYRMDDGRLGFCLDVGRLSPVGHSYTTTATSQISGTTAEQTARLAFIARSFAFTPSADDAAAAQLAVWTITGLHGHSQSYYAGRAGGRAAAVVTRANEILRSAAAQASIRAEATVDLRLDDRGVASVQTDIAAVHPDGTRTTVPKGTYSGVLKLLHAKLPNGSSSGSVANGTRIALTADTSASRVAIRADATFTALKIGGQVTVGSSAAGSQRLLYSAGAKGVATASATASALSPRPFRPRVVTQTSRAQVSPGAELRDRLTVSAAPGEGLLGEWGRYRSGDTTAPIPVTVKSRLLGPFADAVRPSAEWPASAPVVCTVSTAFTEGPGTATTPACRVPETGHYVWVETIEPADTPADRGRDRVEAWRSPFGTASEATFSPSGVSVHTTVADETLEAGGCAVDELDVTGLPASGGDSHDGVEVESLLLGPYDAPVADGTDLSDLGAAPVAGTTTTRLAADGSYTTPCLRVSEPGHYVFVFRSAGSAPDASGHREIAPFSDLVAHAPEMLTVAAPEKPTAPPTTPAVVTPPATTPPVATPPVTAPPVTPAVVVPRATRTPRPQPAALAFTGSSSTAGLLALGGLGVSLGALSLGGRALLRRRRARLG